MIEIPMREGRTDLANRTLRPDQRRELFGLVKNEPLYLLLLDLMEMQCIQTEIDMINADAADDSKVLAMHKISKAAWQFYVNFQKRIQLEVNALNDMFMSESRDEPISPDLSGVEHLMP